MITAAEVALLTRTRKANAQRGQAHHKASLTDDQVRQMRETWVAWADEDADLPKNQRRGYIAIAKLFGCHWRTAVDLVNGRTRATAGGPFRA